MVQYLHLYVKKIGVRYILTLFTDMSESTNCKKTLPLQLTVKNIFLCKQIFPNWKFNLKIKVIIDVKWY